MNLSKLLPLFLATVLSSLAAREARSPASIVAPVVPLLSLRVPVMEVLPNVKQLPLRPSRCALYRGDGVLLDTGLGGRSPEVDVTWEKNGQPLQAVGPVLALEAVTEADAGVYVAKVPDPFLAFPVTLEVVHPGHVANVSTRGEISGSRPLIAGYTVTGQTPKQVLIRAVGPSLAAFGVGQAVEHPYFRLFDAKGQEITRAHILLVGAPEYWDSIFEAAGAFSLPGGEEPYEAYDLFTLEPGAYTVHALDRSEKGGTVLLEIYEVPEYTGIVF